MATAAERIKSYQKSGGNSRVSQLLSPSLKKQAEDYNRSKRDKIFKTSQEESLKQTQEQIGLQEDNRGAVSFLMRNAKDLIRLATRGKQDEEYLQQIQQNNKTLSELIKARKNNPDKANDYNLMMETLLKKNEALTGATGGNTKDLSTGQMFAKSVGAVTELIPTLGGGMTAAGAAARATGGKILAGSLAKEGFSLGLIGGASEVVEKKQTKPAEIFGTLATNAIISTVAGVGLGLGMTKLADKLGEYFAGGKVNFTPKEKDVLEENVPEFSDEELFRQAGLESPIEKTDTDLTAKTIAASDDEADIKSILSGKVPDEDADFLSKSLKNITDEDEIASILDEYDPAKVKANLAEKISMLDNEKRIGSLLKDTVSEADIPRVSKLLKNMENEDEIIKVLDEFEAKKLADDAAKVTEDTAIQTPEVKVGEPSVEKPMYHGSNVEISGAIKVGDKSSTGGADLGTGIYLSESKGRALEYGKKLNERFISPDAKIKEISQMNDLYPDGQVMTPDKITARARAEGYDGIRFGKDTVVFDSDKLLTKDELAKYNKSKKETPEAKSEEPKAKEEPKKEAPKVEEPTPSVRKTPSGLSESTVAKAVKADIMRETIDIPELSTMDMDEQAKMATKLLFDDTEKAIDIALGNQNPPNGIKAGSVYIAVRNYALANNDFDLIKQLATADKINNFARALGQEIKAFDGSMYSDPVQVMREVMRLKNEIFKKSGKNPKQEMSEAMDALQKSMDENTSTDEDFEAFIKSKKC